jgi:hypothetical protein
MMMMTTSRARRNALGAAVALIVALGVSGTAAADDHLFNGAHSNGVDARGFGLPLSNPSETSAGKAQPGTVPGLGDPKTGDNTGTPSFSCDTLISRLDARSEGHGPTCGD